MSWVSIKFTGNSEFSKAITSGNGEIILRNERGEILVLAGNDLSYEGESTQPENKLESTVWLLNTRDRIRTFILRSHVITITMHCDHDVTRLAVRGQARVHFYSFFFMFLDAYCREWRAVFY